MEEYTNSRVAALINEYCHSERDRALLKRRLIDGIVIERLAEEFALSPRQVGNILRREEGRIFRHIRGNKE